MSLPLHPLVSLFLPSPSAALIMHLHVAYADRIRILCTLSILYRSVCMLCLYVCVSCFCMCVGVYVLYLCVCVCLYLCGSLMNKMQLVHFVAFVRLAYSSSCRCFNYVDEGEGQRRCVECRGVAEQQSCYKCFASVLAKHTQMSCLCLAKMPKFMRLWNRNESHWNIPQNMWAMQVEWGMGSCKIP